MKQQKQMARIKTAKPPRSIIKEEDGTDRVVTAGLPDYTRCDNTLITSKYTILNFLPLVSYVFTFFMFTVPNPSFLFYVLFEF